MLHIHRSYILILLYFNLFVAYYYYQHHHNVCIAQTVVYVIFVGNNLKVSHCRHIRNCTLINNFHTYLLGIFMIHLRTKFRISVSNVPFLIAIKLKARYAPPYRCHVILHSTNNY
jgi:hypothetical protein